jgi:PBSX family phage terminase large subunit
VILTPSQNEIAADTHRFRILNCGRRFGKTTLAVEEIKGKAVAKPTRIAYVAPTYQQARDIAWEQLKRELKSVAIAMNESRLEIRTKTLQGGESLVVLRGWESIETLRGQQLDFIVMDEVASMRNFWLSWQEVIRPTLTDTKGEALFISSPKGFNHFYDLFNMQEKDADYKSFHYTTYDNPHIPVEEIDKAKAELTPDRFAQEYEADFRKTEGLVYKEFDRARNVITEEQLTTLKNEGLVLREHLVGIDFGYTNPCAVISIWRDNTDTLYVLDEFYETQHTDAQVAEYVAALNANRVYPDPESPAAIAELRRRHVNVREVLKGKDSIKNGIDRVREALKANKLYVHASCRNLIAEFETYVYPDKKPDHNEQENPMDENNHALDAVRYVVSMLVSEGQAKAQQFYPSHSVTTATQLERVNEGGRVSYPHLPRKESY